MKYGIGGYAQLLQLDFASLSLSVCVCAVCKLFVCAYTYRLPYSYTGYHDQPTPTGYSSPVMHVCVMCVERYTVAVE